MIDQAQYLAVEAIKTVLLIAAPVLLTALVVGVTVSILQAVTQVHEMTLTFVPKVLIVLGVLLLLWPWAMDVLMAFTRHTFSLIGGAGG